MLQFKESQHNLIWLTASQLHTFSYTDNFPAIVPPATLTPHRAAKATRGQPQEIFNTDHLE